MKKPVIVIDMERPERTNYFGSIAEASRHLDVDASCVSRAASGDRGAQTAAGKYVMYGYALSALKKFAAA